MAESRSRMSRLAAWLGSRDLLLLLAVLAIVCGVWFFIELADEVIEGDTRDLDHWLIRVMRNPEDVADPRGPRWLEEAARDVTALGGYAVLTLVIAAFAGFLAIRRKHHAVFLLLGATIGGMVIMDLLKAAINRPRPDIVPHLAYAGPGSFPSGHAMLSAVVYLTLGAMLARLVEGRRLKTYILAVALLLTFLVGVTRIYLGVHYPTDVLAGWTAGLVWAVFGWLLTRALQRRGAVENDTPAPGEPNGE